KAELALRISFIVISILLHAQNNGTNAFQQVMGIFLSGAGASRRVIETLCRMGITVSYSTVQSALESLTKDATERARFFVLDIFSERLWCLVYDNINFTWRKASQRLDSLTRQINATTAAIIALPIEFARSVYKEALSVTERRKAAGKRQDFTEEKLIITEKHQDQCRYAFEHGVRTILLERIQGRLQKKKIRSKLRKETAKRMPSIRPMSYEKTEFFPLPALNQEEASVNGTIRVVQTFMTKTLGFVEELIDTELRLFVGDWLTIRNLRLVREERFYEDSDYERMDWVQEASLPFHFQLNAMYMLFRTHLGTIGGNPSWLENHRTILRRGKLDPKKPEYNKAKELVMHSLYARILDCARIVDRFATTAAAHEALDFGDEVLAHAIFFIRDALLFWEFCDAVRYADPGRINYGNELLEMKAQFELEFSPKLCAVIERTWIVNRWGLKGRSIPTDLYLEHNNGFTK
ncbi:hypothetical protein MPER_12435, partial [Moniliophthora perniciosa FA553]